MSDGPTFLKVDFVDGCYVVLEEAEITHFNRFMFNNDINFMNADVFTSAAHGGDIFIVKQHVTTWGLSSPKNRERADAFYKALDDEAKERKENPWEE